MRLIKQLFLVVVMVASLGCGDASRNSQGTSFLFSGWFQDAEGTTGLSFLTYDQTLLGPDNSTDLLTSAFANLINLMPGQGIRLQRIHHSYQVPGATISIPSTSVGINSFLVPAPGDSDSTFPSDSLGEGGASEVFAGAPVIPSQVFEFITLNRSHFPDTPFTMVVTSYAEGVTTSGERIQSNETTIDVIFTSDLVI